MLLTFRFPYQRFVWVSPMALETARESLSAHMTRRATGPSDKPLRGAFRGDVFRCVRVTSYRNRFAPVLQARLVSDGHVTRVEGVVRLQLPTAIFLSLWLAGILVVVCTGLGRGSFGHGERIWLLSLPLLSFGLVLTCLVFGTEAQQIEHILKHCLRVRPAAHPNP